MGRGEKSMLRSRVTKHSNSGPGSLSIVEMFGRVARKNAFEVTCSGDDVDVELAPHVRGSESP